MHGFPLSATDVWSMCSGLVLAGLLRRADVKLLRVIFDINMRECISIYIYIIMNMKVWE